MLVEKVIKVGIIGQGRSGRNIHGETLHQMRRKFEIVGISDRLIARRERAKHEYGCRTYATPAQLLKQTDIDLIVNASPSRLHVPLSLQALAAGFHVLCEKPLARSVQEVDQVIKAQKKSDKVMAVFQNRRYGAEFQKIKKVLDSGVLGRPLLIKVAYNNFSRRWDWQTMRKHYGGSLLNTGPHAVDQALNLLSSDGMPKVTSHLDRANTFGDAEDHVKIFLKGKGLPSVDIEISSCSAFPSVTTEIYATQGGLQHDGSRVCWRYLKRRAQPTRTLTETPIENAAGLPAYCREELKWNDRTWQPPKRTKTSEKKYYDMLHRVLTQGDALEVTLPQVRQQVAVMEECHRQNPPSKMSKGE